VEGLEVLDLGFEPDHAVGERFGCVRVLACLVGVAGLCGLVGHDHSLTRVARDLLELLERARQAHLGLLLVGDDVRRLLLEPPMLVLGLGDGLFELDLRVGVLLEPTGQTCGRVGPPALEELDHGASLTNGHGPERAGR
jgi:hypothetical protein